ncbi:inorganic phosphate transporter [Streptomyces sp. NPDC021020]|uniref:inorganic phosphate transporter n=1 Tax=Streptomyces sp. NPDC021020 TaxID=3365109 RepID=UPI0037967DA8
MDILVLVLVLALAAANGANDVPKGVATLAGAGVAKVRTAIGWGTITTAVGCLVSLHFASKMTALFSKGIVSADPTPAFGAAVLIGTVAWVALATWRGLPVSTTHALTGALLGAGSLFASSAVQWSVLLKKVVEPLLLSVLIAWAISALLAVAARVALRRLAAARPPAQQEPEPVPGPGGGGATTATVTRTATEPRTEEETQPTGKLGAVGVAHWLTSGLTSFARGMNDAPKIVAIGSFALVSGMTPTRLLFAVTAVMAVGGLVVGSKVAGRLANDVIKMEHVEGFTANLTTAALVGLGAFQGLPMSTTHVSIGAISGTAGTDLSRIKKKTVRDFAIAWVVTPPFAAAVAALAYLALR